MTKRVSNILFFLLFSLAGSLVHAQYLNDSLRLVKVPLDKITMAELSALGLEADHGMLFPGRYWLHYMTGADLEILQSNEILYSFPDPGSPSPLTRRNFICPKPEIPLTPPAHFRLGNMGGFFTLEEMNTILDSMHLLYPDLITGRMNIDTFHTWEDRPMQWLRISNRPNEEQDKPKILYTALHHAREPMSLSQLIYFMWHLLENYEHDERIKNIIDNSELYFIPCINPDGYVYNAVNKPGGGGFWRKNKRINSLGILRGVDINRNYGYKWGHDNTGSSPSETSETYRGPEAFSEPETKAIRFFTDRYKPELVLNYHTWGNYLIYPWAYTADTCPDYTAFRVMGKAYALQNEFKIGNSVETVGYFVNGGADDWHYGHDAGRKVFSFTPEVGSQQEGFWPPKSNIIQLANNTLESNIIFSLFGHGYFTVLFQDSWNLVRDITNPISFKVNKTSLPRGDVSLDFRVISQNASLTESHYDIPARTEEYSDYVLEILPGPATQQGDEVWIEITRNLQYFTMKDTVSFQIWNSQEKHVNTCDDVNTIEAGSVWGTEAATFISSPSCFTDSPGRGYPNNLNAEMILEKSYVIPTSGATYLSYWAKWDIEPVFDYAQVFAVVNGIQSPLCTRYTKAGGVFQDIDQPVYEGFQPNWVKELISLEEFAGSTIQLGFRMLSDSLQNMDGIYIDDISVITLSTSLDAANKSETASWSVYPIPAHDELFINISPENTIYEIIIRDMMGRKQLVQKFNYSEKYKLDIKYLPLGIYTVEVLCTNGYRKTMKWIKS